MTIGISEPIKSEVVLSYVFFYNLNLYKLELNSGSKKVLSLHVRFNKKQYKAT